MREMATGSGNSSKDGEESKILIPTSKKMYFNDHCFNHDIFYRS